MWVLSSKLNVKVINFKQSRLRSKSNCDSLEWAKGLVIYFGTLMNGLPRLPLSLSTIQRQPRERVWDNWWRRPCWSWLGSAFVKLLKTECVCMCVHVGACVCCGCVWGVLFVVCGLWFVICCLLFVVCCCVLMCVVVCVCVCVCVLVCLICAENIMKWRVLTSAKYFLNYKTHVSRWAECEQTSYVDQNDKLNMWRPAVVFNTVTRWSCWSST